MLLDVRTYTARPGTLKKHLALYEEHGFDIQRKHLGEPLAYLVAESGRLNCYTHIWVYQDAADRNARRDRLQADPAWAAYLEKSANAAYLVSQENQLMTPAKFAPLQWPLTQK
ncbi:NIPSNAP family containing protein [Herbaspirillum hiltneri N3]|uniref:NIPSNAP family containing protein n=1 Tax=Herbaspirillum hiltneri N3 TaxID=1262470 RepID=A0ABN4I186_9BURK|nr:NIPSNAP family protein [Herbaspirillum hiltneri]AKZ64714.1 NIPSNAP family containing protein [Herbaspirillum hiltneri N3]